MSLLIKSRLPEFEPINTILADILVQDTIQVIDGFFRELFVSISSEYASYQCTPNGIKQTCFKFYFVPASQMIKRIATQNLKLKCWCYKRIESKSIESQHSFMLYPAIVEKLSSHKTGKHGRAKFMFNIILPQLYGRQSATNSRFMSRYKKTLKQPVVTKYLFQFVSLERMDDNADKILVNAQSKSVQKVFSIRKESKIYRKLQSLVELQKHSNECIHLKVISAPIIHLTNEHLSKSQSIKVTRLWAIVDVVISL
eukprot:212346_1